MIRSVLAFAATLAFACPVAAQHAHGNKWPNGGLMEDVAGVHAAAVLVTLKTAAGKSGQARFKK